jgi:hypothetical protein
VSEQKQMHENPCGTRHLDLPQNLLSEAHSPASLTHRLATSKCAMIFSEMKTLF